jgi:SAM-dependent methyltransferase
VSTDWSPDLREYYDRRASEYERVYARDDPVRQSELDAMGTTLRLVLERRRVLEIACGTGYWTAIAGRVADHVVAVDISPRMLAVARDKRLDPAKVELRIADVYALHEVPGHFDAALAMFWLSHVPKARRDEFLTQFHARLERAAVVFMADNVYMPGVGGELVERPGCADTFKRRQLVNGSSHEIVKNYFDREQLCDLLRPCARRLRIHVGRCFWWLSYETCG